MKKTLEICVDSLASARAAISGGADRLELCSALAVGGLTPYTALLRLIRKESNIPVRCLIRPRAGDFLYSVEEVELMAMQIQELREAGADGFVIGCLTPDGNLDAEAMRPLIEAADNTGLTLHRAMDVSRNLLQTYQDAAELGIDTILTSGGACSCVEGKENIGKLLKLKAATSGPEILIGAGVNASVIHEFRRLYPDSSAFHMSGKTDLESGMKFRRKGVPMGLPGLDEWHIQQTCEESVKAARSVLDSKAL